MISTKFLIGRQSLKSNNQTNTNEKKTSNTRTRTHGRKCHEYSHRYSSKNTIELTSGMSKKKKIMLTKYDNIRIYSGINELIRTIDARALVPLDTKCSSSSNASKVCRCDA